MAWGERRWVPPAPAAALIALGAVAALGADPAAPPSPRFVFPQVQQAWDDAGDDGVKDWMRATVKRAKRARVRLASGAKPKCGSCHESLKSYELSPNALEDLAALLALDLR